MYHTIFVYNSHHDHYKDTTIFDSFDSLDTIFEPFEPFDLSPPTFDTLGSPYVDACEDVRTVEMIS
jgi:hypothetical protein